MPISRVAARCLRIHLTQLLQQIPCSLQTLLQIQSGVKNTCYKATQAIAGLHWQAAGIIAVV